MFEPLQPTVAAAPELSESPESSESLRSRTERTEALLKAFHEEAVLGNAYDARLIGRLWPFISPHRRLVILSIGTGIITSLAALSRPLIMRFAIDDGVAAKDPSVLLRGGLMLAGVVIFSELLRFVQTYSIQVAGARAMAALRQRVFGFLHELRLAYFDRQPVGRLVTRVVNDVDAVFELFGSGALNALTDMLSLIGIVVMMLILDWRLALISFAAVPPVALLARAVRRRAREAFREIRSKTARMNATVNEQVSGMSVVQAFGQQEAAAEEFDRINVAYREANIRAIKFEATQDAAIEMVSTVCLASILLSLAGHPVSFGTVVAFNAYLLSFFEPISALAQRYTILQSAMAGAERVFGLLDLEEQDAPPRDAAAATDENVALSFDSVDFEYREGVPILRGVSFEAKVGEKLALVGPTGAGKSTVTALLLRLYEIQNGVVRVQGRDVVGCERTELRRKFAVVPQEVFLFPGTVASNIALGETEDRERVEGALRRIGAYETFTERAGGLDAPVVERGANFSAGERQLIAFARAMYRDAEILILDEATASVDSATEARLQHALEELMRDRTSLIIAHRLSTIRHADRIVAFARGRVVEQGTHAELLEAGGLYARLHELHFSKQAGQGTTTNSDV
ncbi:MAG: ABC transporter ATP-binding protein [Polyangiaceae bacterium]|nr:ABC transporter ATP-binding protein [Polyangiaceae bacterium]